MTDRVRAFFALPLPGAAREALADAQRTLKRRAGDGPRFVDPGQLHLTLKFLGWVDPDLVPVLQARITLIAIDTPPIDTSFAGFTAFPAVRHARVVAVELADPRHALGALADRLQDAAAELGIPREQRAFRAHVTIARSKRPCSVERWIDAAPLDGALRFEELVLYRSQLLPTGSVYSTLARVRLGAALAPAPA